MPKPDLKIALLFLLFAGLASFNKNIRSRNLHSLILTWLGVISQLLWRLGTIGARCLALALYASAYKAWLLLFGFMHWICMITWIQVIITYIQGVPSTRRPGLGQF